MIHKIRFEEIASYEVEVDVPEGARTAGYPAEVDHGGRPSVTPSRRPR